MSSCSRSINVLSYLMGELNEDDRALFEKHLESCPICRHELKLERILQNGLVECTLPDTAPTDLRLNVLSKIPVVRRPRFPIWQIAVTLLSGAAVFLVLLRILLGANLPETAITLLTDLIDGVFSIIDKADYLPLMISAGIVLVGIAWMVTSLLTEE